MGRHKLSINDTRPNIRVSGKICEKLRQLREEAREKGKLKTTIQILNEYLKIDD